MKTDKKHIRTDIQALRALAVLAVVIYHLWPGRLTGGFMGVDIFFVISGYLMTLTLLRNVNPVVTAKKKLRATGRYLAEFYARRIKRLIPAASVTLLGVLGLITITGNLSIIESTAKQVSTSAVFVQNLFLAHESVDYLASSNPPTAVQHFWSLSLEEQFYLVWPLLLLVTVLLTIHLNIVYKRTKISGAVLPVGLLIALFFLYGYQMTQEDSAAAYFVTFARVWELLFGALIAFLPKLRHHDLKLLLPWAGLAMIAYALYKLDGNNFPGWHALIPVIGTSLIIWGGTDSDHSRVSFTRAFKARVIQWIGNISYSLYLWHWPLIILLPIIFMIDVEGKHGVLIKLSILALSFVMAWLSYRFIEQPTQKLQLKKRWIYLSFIVIVGGISVGSFVLSHNAKAEAETRLKELHQIALSKSDPCLGGYALLNRDKCGEPFGQSDGKFSEFNAADTSAIVIRNSNKCEMYWPAGPSRSETTHLLKDLCIIGDSSSNHKIVLWGDSHAQHWINTFDQIGIEKNIQFIVAASGNCQSVHIDNKECANRINFVKESGVLEDSDAIIVSVWHRFGADNSKQPTYRVLEWLKEETDTPIYLLEDIPSAKGQGGPRCLIDGKSCVNPVDDVLKNIKDVSQHIVDAKILPKKSIISTSDMFCDDKKCYSFIGGLPVYKDLGDTGNSHITGTLSLTFADILQSKLEAHGVMTKKSRP